VEGPGRRSWDEKQGCQTIPFAMWASPARPSSPTAATSAPPPPPPPPQLMGGTLDSHTQPGGSTGDVLLLKLPDRNFWCLEAGRGGGGGGRRVVGLGM
jgi:hypothetical protein